MSELEEIIISVIRKFIFPDGCLDLSGDDLDSFIETLVEEINEQQHNKHI